MSRSLPNMIENMIHYNMDDTNTLLVGKIINYYPESQRADVLPLQELRVRDEWVKPSQILDCPVLFQNTGDFYVRNPYKPEDIVLLGFNKYSIDNALIDGEIRQPEHERTFELSDCIVLGGLSLINQEYIDKENVSDFMLDCKNVKTKIRITPNGDIFIDDSANITISNKGNIKITNDGNIDAINKGDISVSNDGKTSLNSVGKVSVTCSDSIEMRSNSLIALTAPQIGLNGAISMKSGAGRGATTATLEGSLNVSQSGTFGSDVSAGGISLMSHVHTGNMNNPTSPPIGGGLYLSNETSGEISNMSLKDELVYCKELMMALMLKVTELEEKINNDTEF